MQKAANLHPIIGLELAALYPLRGLRIQGTPTGVFMV